MPLTGRRARVCCGVAAVAAAAYAGGIAVGHALADPGTPAESLADEAADRIAQTSALPIDPAALQQAAVGGMVGALGDRWASFQPAAGSAHGRDTAANGYSGVGVRVSRGTGGALLVGAVQPGSPADSAGLRTGSELVSVAGEPVAGRSTAEVAAALRGPAGTAVVVVERMAGEEHAAVLTRASVADPEVRLESRPDGAAVLTVTAFARGVGAQARAALDDAGPGARRAGIVLDLRGNRGGLLDEAVELAGEFLDPGTVVSYERRGRPDRVLGSTGVGDTRTPLVVLVDGGTASAAEVVAAALQDRGRAVVVGAQTYGKGVVQEPIRLSDGSTVEVTVGRFRTPGGRTLDGVGVEPDVLVPASAGPAAGERRAREVLGGLAAALATASGRG